MFTEKATQEHSKDNCKFSKYRYILTNTNAFNTLASNLTWNDMHIHECNEYISYT